MATISNLLLIVIGIVLILTHLDYLRLKFNNLTTPNTTTWFVWMIGGLLNSSTYLGSSNDPALSSIPSIGASLCSLTLIILLFKNGPESVKSKWIFATLGLCVPVLLAWKYLGAGYANIITQAILILGFIPTWQDLSKDPFQEHERPWVLLAICHLGFGIAVWLRWEGNWINFVYPVLCCLLYISVPLLRTLFIGLASDDQLTDIREQLEARVEKLTDKVIDAQNQYANSVGPFTELKVASGPAYRKAKRDLQRSQKHLAAVEKRLQVIQLQFEA